MNISEILLARNSSVADSDKSTLLSRLESFLPDEGWGIDCNFINYTGENKKNLWNNEIRSTLKNYLIRNNKSESDYANWLGGVYYSYTSIYIKSLFEKYRGNAGWRIALISIPRTNVIAIGLSSHYQNAQNHNNLGRVSNFFFDFTNDSLSDAETQLVGRKVASEDWDGSGLLQTPITSVAGLDIRNILPDGIQLKDIRNTTLKKTLASFISIKVLPSNIGDDELRAEIHKVTAVATELYTLCFPYKTLEEFESLRALALQDMANAATRIALRKRSSSRSIVRIFYGPPGTGKTLTAVKEAVKITKPSIGDQEDPKTDFSLFNQMHTQCAFITFHPSLQYEDLVESIRPVLSLPEEIAPNQDDIEGAKKENLGSLQYIIHEGLLLRMIRRALKSPSEEFVVVVDEINRGDISRILGPLISALEPDKRVGAEFPIGFELQYPLAQELESRLYMPSNLHILGTMNSSDRNIALVDHALRRRFDFIEIPPDSRILYKTDENPPIDCKCLLDTINKRITSLLGRDFCIGHGYFSYCKKNSDVIENMAKKIIPLLKEYFYGNENLILLVLGDNSAQAFNFFKPQETEEDFEKNFSVAQDLAESMGYQPYSVPQNIQIDPRFWNPHQLVPAPDDQEYAVKCILKLCSPQV